MEEGPAAEKGSEMEEGPAAEEGLAIEGRPEMEEGPVIKGPAAKNGPTAEEVPAAEDISASSSPPFGTGGGSMTPGWKAWHPLVPPKGMISCIFSK
jgi:hypothetical protein